MTRILLTVAYLFLGTGALAWCRQLGLIDWPWLSIFAPLWLSALALILGGAVVFVVLSIGSVFEALDRRFPLDRETKDKDV